MMTLGSWYPNCIWHSLITNSRRRDTDNEITVDNRVASNS